MPTAFTEKPLQNDYEYGYDEIRNQKNSGMPDEARGRLFKRGKKRQENDNWARIDNLPLEVTAIRLLGAHARDAFPRN